MFLYEIYICVFQLSLCYTADQKVDIIEELEDIECFEGDTIMFKCRISPSDYCNVRWYVDRTLLYTDHLNEIKTLPEGYHTLTIKKLARKDSGTISFEAGSKRTYASLLVKGNYQFSQTLTNASTSFSLLAKDGKLLLVYWTYHYSSYFGCISSYNFSASHIKLP